jgi:hypothetical protein
LVEQKRSKARERARAPGLAARQANASSFIRTVTVGSSIELDLLTFLIGSDPDEKALAGSRLAPPTAGGEFHPALKTLRI